MYIYTNNLFSILMQFFICKSFHNQLPQINMFFSYKSFQQFKSFCNHLNTLKLEREKWRTNSKMETKERVEEQTKKLMALDSNHRNLDQFELSSLAAPIPIQLTIILFVTTQIPGVPLTTVNLRNTHVSYHETHT